MPQERDWKARYLKLLDENEQQEQDWEAERRQLQEGLVAVAGAAWGRDVRLDALLKELRTSARQGASAADLLEQAKLARDLALRELEEEETTDSAPAQPAAARYQDLAILAGEPARTGLELLLGQLELPAQLEERADALREQLQGLGDDEPLGDAVQEVAALLNAVRAQVLAETQEFESYLQTLSETLERLQGQLAEILGQGSSAVASGADLQRDISARLQGMRDHVEGSEDLTALKAAVRQNLDEVEELVSEFVSARGQQGQDLEKALVQLRNELRAVRSEADRLRDELAEQRRLASTDALTGLLNRMALDDRLKQEMSRWRRHGHPLSVVIVDVDHFKLINDRYGHQTGDRVLQELAQRMRKVARDSDTLGRYGGEEFVMVLPDTGREQAVVAAEKVRVLVEKLKFHYEGKPVPVTLSAGVAQAAEDEAVGRCVARADAALYAAKQAGRNRVAAAD